MAEKIYLSYILCCPILEARGGRNSIIACILVIWELLNNARVLMDPGIVFESLQVVGQKLVNNV